jgi:hypothetical protein
VIVGLGLEQTQDLGLVRVGLQGDGGVPIRPSIRLPIHDDRIDLARRLASEEQGWRLLYRRGYSLNAPPRFARSWLIDHLPYQAEDDRVEGDRRTLVLAREPSPAIRVSYARRGLVRFTEWNLSIPDSVLATDSVWKRDSLEILGREEYRFMGDENGSILELSLHRKPVSLVSRVGFGLLPGMSGNTVSNEVELVSEMERAFTRGSSVRMPAPER